LCTSAIGRIVVHLRRLTFEFVFVLKLGVKRVCSVDRCVSFGLLLTFQALDPIEDLPRGVSAKCAVAEVCELVSGPAIKVALEKSFCDKAQ
jgi:hypothetical protein